MFEILIHTTLGELGVKILNFYIENQLIINSLVLLVAVFFAVKRRLNSKKKQDV